MPRPARHQYGFDSRVLSLICSLLYRSLVSDAVWIWIAVSCVLSCSSCMFFTTRTAVRNQDTAARTTARGKIPADARCAVLAGVVANPFLCLPTTNLTNPPTPPAVQQYSLTTRTSSSAAVFQCQVIFSPGGPRSDACSCFELCVRTSGNPTHLWSSATVVISAAACVELQANRVSS